MENMMTENNPDSFSSAATLTSGATTVNIFRLKALSASPANTNLSRLPFSLRILLENLLRHEDGRTVTADDITFLANWDPKAEPSREIAYMPARVLMQDFTGVPAIVDLAAMRDAMKTLGGDPEKINPLQPAELVIDHSVQVDEFGTVNSYDLNAALEFTRNRERYAFLKWGQTAFNNFSTVPPGMGICHQVNLEYLARVVFTTKPIHSLDAVATDGAKASTEKTTVFAYPDTLVGTDSHTTMVNGLGVLGWGVGGIEAEAAMLGQPVSMLVPRVVGFKLTGERKAGVTATDVVLTVTEMLRKHGVVGKFVEFYGEGVAEVPLANRATLGNMSPEFGSTAAIFPIDEVTIEYLKMTGRSEEQLALVEAYSREQGLFHDANIAQAEYSELLALDLATVEPSLAGPKRPQDRVPLSNAKQSFEKALPSLIKPGKGSLSPVVSGNGHLSHGSVVIAAITSCTNTSNPSVMLAAGLLAKKAVERGLQVPGWVKTSLAPGSKVVRDYLENAGLISFLETLKFHIVGYGCTTCIGNSGPLPEEVAKEVDRKNLVVASVLSGNRNFEGRINPDVRANYLMSPPLVVAFALAGRIDLDLRKDSLGAGKDGKPVYLADIWPSQQEVQNAVASCIDSEMFRKSYGEV